MESPADTQDHPTLLHLGQRKRPIVYQVHPDQFVVLLNLKDLRA
jgi:hypothetical protein